MEKILYSKILGTVSLNKWYSLHMFFYLTDQENTLKINIIKPYIEFQIARIYDENT